MAYLYFYAHITVILLGLGFSNWLTSSILLTVKSFIVENITCTTLPVVSPCSEEIIA